MTPALRVSGLGLLLCSLLAGTAASQGFGHRKLRVDAEAATPHAGNGSAVDDALLGVQFLGGEYFVTGRDAANLAGNHSIYVYDAAGALQRVLDQPTYTQSSPWGFRDGISDGIGLGFGFEGGIGFLDPQGAALTTFDGITLPAQPVTYVGFTGATYRALAYDPTAQTIFVADFGSDIHEFDLATGALLNTWPNPAGDDAWFAYGLALDPLRTAANEAFLWISGNANDGNIRGYTLPRNGLGSIAIASEASIERDDPLSNIGGLSGVPGGTPGWSPTSAWDLVALDQGASDTFSTYRVHLYTSCDGTEEPSLVGGAGRTLAEAQANASKNTPIEFYPGDFIYWNYHDPTGVPRLATVWGNVKVPVLDETDDRDNTLFDPSFELAIAWAGSNPPGLLPLYLAPNLTAGTGGLGFPIPVGAFFPDDAFRLQGMVLDSCLTSFPAYATNQIKFVALDGFRPPVRVAASGVNSFNDDDTRGFWTIHNQDPQGRTIVSVKLDWAASTDPRQATMRFDTDQIGMSDLFEGGNSVAPGCSGTFRSGSDVVTSLVYDVSCTIPTTPCDPSAITGWIGTNAGPSLEDWETLEFRFTDFQVGETFEFDCDTDGGLGLSGADMIGLVVTVELSDATILVGELTRTGFNESSVIL